VPQGESPYREGGRRVLRVLCKILSRFVSIRFDSRFWLDLVGQTIRFTEGAYSRFGLLFWTVCRDLADRPHGHLRLLRTMCGLRTSGWSLPGVMSD
jgi:hypothetical protein